MKGARIDHVNIRVPEDMVEEALTFYRDVLGLETMRLEEYKSGKRTSFFFRISGESVINIRPKKSFKRPTGKNFDHFCIVVNDEIGEVKSTLEENGIEIIREGNPLGAKDRSSGIYVKDPFGYKIEIKSES